MNRKYFFKSQSSLQRKIIAGGLTAVFGAGMYGSYAGAMEEIIKNDDAEKLINLEKQPVFSNLSKEQFINWVIENSNEWKDSQIKNCVNKVVDKLEKSNPKSLSVSKRIKILKSYRGFLSLIPSGLEFYRRLFFVRDELKILVDKYPNEMQELKKLAPSREEILKDFCEWYFGRKNDEGTLNIEKFLDFILERSDNVVVFIHNTLPRKYKSFFSKIKELEEKEEIKKYREKSYIVPGANEELPKNKKKYMPDLKNKNIDLVAFFSPESKLVKKYKDLMSFDDKEHYVRGKNNSKIRNILIGVGVIVVLVVIAIIYFATRTSGIVEVKEEKDDKQNDSITTDPQSTQEPDKEKTGGKEGSNIGTKVAKGVVLTAVGGGIGTGGAYLAKKKLGINSLNEEKTKDSEDKKSSGKYAFIGTDNAKVDKSEGKGNNDDDKKDNKADPKEDPSGTDEGPDITEDDREKLKK